MRPIATIVAIATGLAVTACMGEETTTSKVSANDTKNCPSPQFAQQATVFKVLSVCATADVPAEKFRYAANVAAEWLDNDADGKADEPRVIKAMESTRPFLIMTESGPDRKLMRELSPALESRVGQDLSADETNPGNGRRDASQEELHHLVMGAGWGPAFPSVFSDREGSELYAQWGLAEKQGNYGYWDFTCDDSCKTYEFFYLATAAYLGSSADLQSNEMRLKTRAELAAALPGTVKIMQSSAYHYPTDHWPRGSYAHPSNIQYQD